MQNVTLELTKEQAKELSTVVTFLTGCLQLRAIQKSSQILDDDWRFWNKVSSALSESIGYSSYCDPTSDLAESLLNH